MINFSHLPQAPHLNVEKYFGADLRHSPNPLPHNRKYVKTVLEREKGKR